MVPAVLEAFSVDNSIGLGKQLHCLIVTVLLLSFFPHQWAYMYVLLSVLELEDSVKVFIWMSERNPISRNSMIVAFSHHGDGTRALQLCEEMGRGGCTRVSR